MRSQSITKHFAFKTFCKKTYSIFNYLHIQQTGQGKGL